MVTDQNSKHASTPRESSEAYLRRSTRTRSGGSVRFEEGCTDPEIESKSLHEHKVSPGSETSPSSGRHSRSMKTEVHSDQNDDEEEHEVLRRSSRRRKPHTVRFPFESRSLISDQ